MAPLPRRWLPTAARSCAGLPRRGAAAGGLAVLLASTGVVAGCGDDGGGSEASATDASGTGGGSTATAGSASDASSSASATASTNASGSASTSAATEPGSSTGGTTTSGGATATTAGTATTGTTGSTQATGTTATTDPTTTGTDTDPTLEPCEFWVIGHRGASWDFPENTAVGARAAFDRGARAIEVDTYVTSDGLPYAMHDGELERTTNGSGSSSAPTLAQATALEAGSFKDPAFVGEPVPSVAELARIAQARGRKIYIDDKVDVRTAIPRMLEQNPDIDPATIILAAASMSELRAYHAAVPAAPIVYFGGIPNGFGGPGFDAAAHFAELKAEGVFVVEFNYYGGAPGDPELLAYREAARAHGVLFGFWTLNDPRDIAAAIAEFDPDWIESDRPEVLWDMVCAGGDGGDPATGRVIGHWTFDAGDLAASVTGSELLPWGSGTPAVQFGSASSFGLPGAAGMDPLVARIPKYGPDAGLRLFTNYMHYGEGLQFGNFYTFVFDVLIPAGGSDAWIALYQTSGENTNEAEAFIRLSDGGIGIAGDYQGALARDRWYRIALAVDTTTQQLSKYVDGQLVGTTALSSGAEGRWSLGVTSAFNQAVLFGDAGGDTGVVFVDGIQLRDYAMSAQEVAALGPAGGEIPLR